ncbi:MAG TPA: hypothetical protein VGN34_25135, partial [Ktedonobacteraceae bacterium]
DRSFFSELAVLAQHLQENIQHHARRSTRNTRARRTTQPEHQIELEEFHMGHAKSLLDEIDALLAHYYGFTDEELNFIVNYDGKYRCP